MLWETPLRTGNLRDPNGPQVTFAFESFIDELAAAAKADPVQFRLDMLDAAHEDDVFRKARSLAVMRGRREGLWLGCAPVAATARRGIARRHALRTRHRLHLPQQHRCRHDRRGRGQSRDRARLGQAPGVRARLRPGHQSRRPAPHRRVRHAARAEPRAVGRSAVRHREGHQRRLGFAPQPAAFGHARDHRHRAGQRRSQSGSSRPRPLRRRRRQPQAADRSGGQRDPRCHRRAAAPAAVPQANGCWRHSRRRTRDAVATTSCSPAAHTGIVR